MTNLVEFINFTKGVEYLIAIAFLIAFIAFWQAVYGSRKGLALKVGLLSYMVLGVVIGVASIVTTAPR